VGFKGVILGFAGEVGCKKTKKFVSAGELGYNGAKAGIRLMEGRQLSRGW